MKRRRHERIERELRGSERRKQEKEIRDEKKERGEMRERLGKREWMRIGEEGNERRR